jgi:hypothetical protein
MPQQAAQMPVVQRHLTLCHCPGKRLGDSCEQPSRLQSALEETRRSNITAVLRRQLRPGMPFPVLRTSGDLKG